MTPKEIKEANRVAAAALIKAEADGPEVAEVMRLTWQKAMDAIKVADVQTDLRRARLAFLKAYVSGKLPIDCYNTALAAAGLI